jgi:hypothetical protein
MSIRTRIGTGLAALAVLGGVAVAAPAQAQAAPTTATVQSTKPVVVVHPAVTVKAAAPAGASLAYTYTTRTQRYDLYPPGCFGYIGVIFTWSLRSDGASLETNLHTGNNMDCGSALSNSYLRWGIGCQPPIWKWGPTENAWGYRGATHDYSDPFGTAYANSAGHPRAYAPFDFTNGQAMTTSDSPHPC